MRQRIFSEGLNTSLEKGLLPLYLLTGQDLLLVGESKDCIVQYARQREFEEKIEVSVATDTRWDDLFEQVQSNGLFSQRQIFILNLPDNLNTTQQKSLAELLAFSHSDLLFILHLPKMTKSIEKQYWFSQIENGVLVNCHTPEASKLPIWVGQRAKSMGLMLDNEAIQLLCYSYEGNLLALKQALQMLQLCFPQEKIGLNRTKEVVEHSAQFTPFQWVDALLEGKITRAVRILKTLQNEDVQPVVLLRIIQKELMQILEMTRSPEQISSHQPLYHYHLRAEFDRLKVWKNRRALYQQFVQRSSYRKLYQLIQTLAELERQVKQEFGDKAWEGLERFSAEFI